MVTDDTLPKVLMANYRRWDDKKIAMRRKAFGIWKEFTWADVYEKVRYFALALLSNGFEPMDKIATLGDNAPELIWAELAAQAAGGVMTGINSDCLPDEVKYQAQHSDSKFMVAEDQEQVDKIIEVQNELPLLKKVVYWDPKGLKGYDDPLLISYNDFLQQGKEYEQSNPGLFEQKVTETKPNDVAFILYTSGTTGLPKGAIIKHKTFITWTREILSAIPLSENDNSLSFMLPGWIIEQLLGFGNMLLAGVTMNFPEELETVQADLREIAPSIIVYPSRLWERLNTEIRVRISDSSLIKRTAFNLFSPVGYKFADMTVQQKKPNWGFRALYPVANLFLFRPLKDKHGLNNVKHAITSGASLSPDILRFLRAIGINIKQIYALTETGVITSQRDDEIQFESVGVPVGESTKVKISEDGEVLIDATHCFDGYYKNGKNYPGVVRDGWFHSGDTAYFQEDGHLIYLDRMADLKEFANGTKFSPQYIESRLKSSPYITDAVVVGTKASNFVAAIIVVDLSIVGKWAGGRNIPYSVIADLSQNPEVCELIRQEVMKVNHYLTVESRVKKFINIRKEFDPDEAELTRTRKIRRAILEHHYQNLIDAIYNGKQELVERTTVTYQDGSKGTVEAVIRINTVEDSP
jgi:long-chain acyl-CoA synthetase